MPLLLIVFGPALAALAVALFPRNRLSVWVVTVPALLFAYLASQVGAAERPMVDIPWVPSLGVHLSFQLDGLGLLFALVITGIGALVLLYATAYFHKWADYARFSSLTLVFMAAMLGIVLSRNLLLVFVFWEITSISSYLLIGFKHEDEAAREGARQALLVTAGGGLALLAGIVLLGGLAGTLDLDVLAGMRPEIVNSAGYEAVLVLILLGAFTKSAQWPFHFWLPGAMAAPTPASTYLHSATMVKAGVYLLARLTPVLGGTDLWVASLSVVGLATFVYGAVFALRQHDLKAILAYSTVSWLGALVAMVASGSTYAATALAVGVVAHALYKGALFLVAGAVDHATGTRDIRLLGGLARAMPLTFAGALVAALSMAGLPPLFGFLAKETFTISFLEGVDGAGLALVPPAVVLVGSALTVAIALRVLWDTFLGPRRGPLPHAPHEGPWALWLPPVALGLVGIVTPFLLAQAVDPLVGAAVSTIRGQPEEIHLHLFEGVNTALILSVVAIALGLAVFALRGRVTAWLQARREPDTGAAYTWAVGRALPATAAGVTARLQTGRLRRYLQIVAATVMIAVLGTTVAGRLNLIDERALSGFDWHAAFICVLLMIGAVAGTTVGTRLSTIMVLGIEGALVAILFALFGAPDLAFTQLMVEVITLVLFVLAFHFLPDAFDYRRTRFRNAVSVGFSVGVGATITVLLLAAGANRVGEPISDWYIVNSVSEGHGANVVNVILVDFRALDTQGEIVVLAIAAMGVVALLRLRPSRQPRGEYVEPVDGLPNVAHDPLPPDDHAPARRDPALAEVTETRS